MEHTYLMHSAHWRVEGIYHPKDGETVPMTGGITVEKKGAKWTLHSSLDVAMQTPLHLERKYKLRKTSNAMELNWTAQDSTCGKIEGTFTVLPGIITSAWAADTVSGSQMIMQVSTDEYKLQNVHNQNGNPQDWWEGRLVRDDNG